MTNVFLSSVARGLSPYRDAVYTAIEGLDEHHCIRMEDFGALDSIPEEVCRARIADCDVFVCILGHDYGSRPPGSETSYTELEYDYAGVLEKKRLVFLAPEEFPIPAHLIETDALRERQRRFRQRVKSEVTVKILGQGITEPGLAKDVVTAIHNCRADLLSDHPGVAASASEKTRLLFPFVTQGPGFDTGISIANTTADPFGSTPKRGTCTLYFYGTMSGPHPTIREEIEFLDSQRQFDFAARAQKVKAAADKAGLAEKDLWIKQTVIKTQTSAVVGPGEQLLFSMFFGASEALILPLQNFMGYMIAECNFPRARGFAFISDVGAQKVAAGYLAEVLA